MAPYPFHLFAAILASSILISLVSPQNQVDQNVLSSLSIPDGETVPVDNTWLSDDSTSETTILIDGDLEVIVPVPIDTDPPPDFVDYSSDVVQQSLPFLLSEFGVDDSDIQALVDEFVPLAHDAIIDAISGPGGVAAEGIFGDIFAWAEKVISKATNIVASGAVDVACRVVAVGGLPLYEAANVLFMEKNTGTFTAATTNDQDFFIFPAHGSISHDDSIIIYYDASFVIGFGDADGVTMGKSIYTNKAASSANVGGSGFQETTKILLHEFTHSKQYQALNYNTIAFGTKYLFDWCKGGGYSGNPMESIAFQTETMMDDLRTDAIGSQFLPIYNTRGLQPSLALPTARSYRTVSSTKYELDFQGGTMSITCIGTSCS